MKRLLEEAKKMIRIKSVSADGNEELANFVAGLMKERGLKTQLQQVMHSHDEISKRQFNVIGVMGDPLVDKKTRKGLLLNTHLDTVSPGLAANWTETGNDPFSATVKDGKIFGLGSADVKLDFLCKLHAVAKFQEKGLKMPIYLVGTCGEEIGMFGAKYLIKSGALNPRFVVVGEPSDLKVVYAHKCLNIFRVTVGYQLMERDVRGFNRKIDLSAYGKSAHGSYPHLGKNAILSLLKFLQSANESGFELRFTSMAGGDTVNKVPDSAKTQFYLTSHQFEDFKRFFRDSLKAEGDDKAYKVEFGGVGDTGVKFLPDALFSFLSDTVDFFTTISKDFEKVKDATYAPAFSTANFGQLKQGAGSMELYYDLRLLPDLMPEEIEKHIRNGMRDIAAKYPNLNVSVVKERMNPGLNMTLDHDLVKHCSAAMESAGLPLALDKKATSTEAAQYFQAGYESVVFGPGLSAGNSHSPNEHNILAHLEKAQTFYEKLIERVCL
jgi:succinyl-diaminopimelate desuccinylase